MKRRPDDLEVRVTTRKQQLITEIIEHKKNSSRSGAAEEVDKIKHQLAELSQILKAGEWSTLSAGERQRLALWVTR